MPAIAAVTLPIDNESPQGTVTLSPDGIDANGVARFSSGEEVYDSRQVLTQSIRLPSKTSKVVRTQIKLVLPMMDQLDDTKRIGEVLVNVEIVMPKSAPQSLRHQTAIELYALCGTGVVHDAIRTAKPYY